MTAIVNSREINLTRELYKVLEHWTGLNPKSTRYAIINNIVNDSKGHRQRILMGWNNLHITLTIETLTRLIPVLQDTLDLTDKEIQKRG